MSSVERDGGVDDKVSQLRSRLESARSLVQSLKGTDLSPDEQLEKAELLQVNKLCIWVTCTTVRNDGIRLC